MVNLFPREVPRVLNLFPRELIESTPKVFRMQTRSCIRVQTLGQKPEGRRPRRFLAEGLAEDAAEGLPEENPEGYFQSTPLGTNLELEGLPEGTDSPHDTRGFSTDCHSNQITKSLQ